MCYLGEGQCFTLAVLEGLNMDARGEADFVEEGKGNDARMQEPLT